MFYSDLIHTHRKKELISTARPRPSVSVMTNTLAAIAAMSESMLWAANPTIQSSSSLAQMGVLKRSREQPRVRLGRGKERERRPEKTSEGSGPACGRKASGAWPCRRDGYENPNRKAWNRSTRRRCWPLLASTANIRSTDRCDLVRPRTSCVGHPDEVGPQWRAERGLTPA